jgi:hypothetical protein
LVAVVLIALPLAALEPSEALGLLMWWRPDRPAGQIDVVQRLGLAELDGAASITT